MWGDPADIGKAIGGGDTFDVVLENNGKDFETVGYVNFVIKIE